MFPLLQLHRSFLQTISFEIIYCFKCYNFQRISEFDIHKSIIASVLAQLLLWRKDGESEMTPKNRTLEGENRTLGVDRGSKIVKNRRTSLMDDPLPDYSVIGNTYYVVLTFSNYSSKKTGLIIDIFLSFPFFQIQTCPQRST